MCDLLSYSQFLFPHLETTLDLKDNHFKSLHEC